MAAFRRSGGRTNSDEQAEVRSPRDSACASDLVKSTRDGEMDWKTLANIMTATLLGEVLCASYADYKYGRRRKDFKPDIEWKFSYEENDVLVFTKQHNAGEEVISFMGRSVIELPVSSIAAVLQNLENFHLWNKFMIESKLVHLLSESDNHSDVIGYFVHESKKCLIRTKRDMVLFLHSSYTPDRFIQAAISVDHPSCPAVSNITRAKCCLGSGWVVEKYEGHRSKSLVSYVCNVDMKGLIPPVILNRFLQRQPLAVHYLRQCAVEMAHKRRGPSTGRARFSLRSSRVSSENGRTVDKMDKEESIDKGSMSPVEFAITSNTLGSFVFIGASSKQYEDPVGISEFIGYHTTPRTKKRQRRRHRCCQEQGTAAGAAATPRDALFSSGSCEECRLRADPNFTAGSNGAGKYNNYITR